MFAETEPKRPRYGSVSTFGLSFEEKDQANSASLRLPQRTANKNASTVRA